MIIASIRMPRYYAQRVSPIGEYVTAYTFSALKKRIRKYELGSRFEICKNTKYIGFAKNGVHFVHYFKR